MELTSDRKILVTGGGGFLGGAIARRLIERGVRVRTFQRGDYPELGALGIEVVRGDLTDREAIARALADCDLVFHSAAKAGVWGEYDEYFRANVVGTENLLAGCDRAGVSRIVFTSSPSVVFNGRDLNGVDESMPYSRRFLAPYSATKAIAEQLILAANSRRLATVALRPHLIWGPGDRHLAPGLIARAAKLRRIGNADPLVDSVFIDNAVDAHMLAAERLEPSAEISGRAFFISNGEPRPIWTLINGILAAADLPPVTKRVPRLAASVAGAIVPRLHRLLGREAEPSITPFLIEVLTTAHWFDITAARRDLGYEPKVSIEEGMRRLKDSIREKSELRM